MKIISRLLAALLFAVFFLFALRNTHETTLVLFLGYEIRSPLVLMLLTAFLCGAVLGVLAMTPTVFRHRREMARHKKNLQHLQHEHRIETQSRHQPPQPDAVSRVNLSGTPDGI
ncbi:LapA family protein [Massilia sp. W12]|uniref:LapA family protein n=1 Tax=Massilia sp. W12 TaxID=3126507 RepID=UPI0030D536CE